MVGDLTEQRLQQAELLLRNTDLTIADIANYVGYAHSQNSNVTVSYDIPNATLALPNAVKYRATNPDRGIAAISVVQVTPTSVRVSITGSKTLPEIQIATATTG